MKNLKHKKRWKLVDSLDVIAIEKMRFDSYGRSVDIWLETDEDGKKYLKPVTMDPNTYQPGADTIASLACYGGNYDLSDYEEGDWCERELTDEGDETGKFIITDKHSKHYKQVVSEAELISICLDEGDWSEELGDMRVEIIEQWEQSQKDEEYTQ